MNYFSARAALLLLIGGLCAGCGAGGGDTEVASNAALETRNIDTSDVLFEPDRLLQIDIEMAPADYDVLRYEGREFPRVMAGCQREYEYSHFSATVTVDGERLENVDIRKKGFLGSLTATRPSFKLNFDALEPGRRFESLDRMTLNNNNQDPSNTHQCIAYQMFRDAGLPAPRCNLARVTLNGEDLGIYSHVDSIRRHFLRRNFADDLGNLYEAQGADFGVHLSNNFQLKTNTDDNDRSDLAAVVDALKADDDNMPGLLGQLVDLDEFLSYWAMEGISGHWDSATGLANNHFVYREVSDGLFHYIPWGADAALELDSMIAPGTGPLYRYTTIAARLYQIPEWQDKYHARVLELLDRIWDEQALHAEVDRIRDLTGTPEEDMASPRNFISKHEARVRDSVSGELVQRERTIVDQPFVCDESRISSIRGSFVNGLGSFEYVNEDGETISLAAFAIAPSIGGDAASFGDGVSIPMIGRSGGNTTVAALIIEKGEFGQTTIPFHGMSTSIFLIRLPGEEAFKIIGMAGGGSITFTEPPELGQPASFEFSADLGLLSGDSPFGNVAVEF